MNAAIVAIDSAAIMVWLIPTMMVFLDIGISTSFSRCQADCPSEWVASRVVG